MWCSCFPLNGPFLERYLWFYGRYILCLMYTFPTKFEILWICVPSTYVTWIKLFICATRHISISTKFMDYPWMSIIFPYHLYLMLPSVRLLNFPRKHLCHFLVASDRILTMTTYKSSFFWITMPESYMWLVLLAKHYRNYLIFQED